MRKSSRSWVKCGVTCSLLLAACSSDAPRATGAPVLQGTAPSPPLSATAPVLLTADHVGDVPARDATGAVVTDASGNVLYALPSATFQALATGLLAPPHGLAPLPDRRRRALARSGR